MAEEVAGGVPPAPDPTQSVGTPAAPAGDAPPAPPAGGAETPPTETPPAGGEPTPPAAAAPPVEAAPERPKPEPGFVPWKEHRLTRRQLRDAEEQLQRLQGEVEPAKKQLSEYETEVKALREQKQLLDDLFAALDARPEVKAQLLEDLNTGRLALPAGSRPGRPGSGPPRDVVAKLDPETEKSLREVVDVVRHARQAADQERQAAARQATETKVFAMVDKFLTERGYDPREALLDGEEYARRDEVFNFILDEGARLGATDLGDVPHLLNRWYAPRAKERASVQSAYAKGKVETARRAPPAAPGGAPPVTTAAPKRYASMTSPEFLADVKEVMRQRLAATDGQP